MEEKQKEFKSLPQRRLTDAEKQYIALKVEKSKLNRERAILILDKGLILFLGFLVMSIIGFTNNFINQITLNVLIIAALCVLLISIIPYSNIAKKAEKEIDDTLESLTQK